jgi:hypothetical protein
MLTGYARQVAEKLEAHPPYTEGTPAIQPQYLVNWT